MDYIDWCRRVLGILEQEKTNRHLSDNGLQNILFGEVAQRSGFRQSAARIGMMKAIKSLSEAGLLDEGQHKIQITPLGRDVLKDPTGYWAAICEQQLDAEEESVLTVINRLSPEIGQDPEYVSLKEVTETELVKALGIINDDAEINLREHSYYIHDLPKLLADRGLLKTRPRIGGHNYLQPTYQGLVWGTRRGFTVESKFIDELILEWETTTVDFKRELHLKTKKEKAEFARDVLGLATTKSSGRRYLIIGFDDKTRTYYGAPDPAISQNQIESILNDSTEPTVNVRYEVIEYRLGKVGKLEVIREPWKLPYRAAKDIVIDDKGRKGLVEGNVYVRHGSQTETPSEGELAALEEEGKRAREESPTER